MSGQSNAPGGVVDRPDESTLSDVVTTILDKGIVIDIYARVSLVGIELLRADARIVVASVDTYLRFAESVNRLQLGESEPESLPEFVDDVAKSGSEGKARGALEAAGEKIGDLLESGEQDDAERAERPRSKEKGRRG